MRIWLECRKGKDSLEDALKSRPNTYLAAQKLNGGEFACIVAAMKRGSRIIMKYFLILLMLLIAGCNWFDGFKISIPMWKGSEPKRYNVGDKLLCPIDFYLIKSHTSLSTDPRDALPVGEKYAWSRIAIASCTLEECEGPTGTTPEGTMLWGLWCDAPGQECYNATWARYFISKVPLDWVMYKPVQTQCIFRVIVHDAGDGWAILSLQPW